MNGDSFGGQCVYNCCYSLTRDALPKAWGIDHEHSSRNWFDFLDMVFDTLLTTMSSQIYATSTFLAAMSRHGHIGPQQTVCNMTHSRYWAPGWMDASPHVTDNRHYPSSVTYSRSFVAFWYEATGSYCMLKNQQHTCLRWIWNRCWRQEYPHTVTSSCCPEFPPEWHRWSNNGPFWSRVPGSLFRSKFSRATLAVIILKSRKGVWWSIPRKVWLHVWFCVSLIIEIR